MLDKTSETHPCMCMFCGNHGHDILNIDEKVSQCPDFCAFMKEKVHFEATKSCSLEWCSQVLLGTFVEFLRMDSPRTIRRTPDYSFDGCRHYAQSSVSGEIDPSEWAGKQAREMCERLLQDEDGWQGSQTTSKEVVSDFPCDAYAEWNHFPSTKEAGDLGMYSPGGLWTPWQNCHHESHFFQPSCMPWMEYHLT
jgi:hypothetical protein